jgi:hypothetical protein
MPFFKWTYPGGRRRRGSISRSSRGRPRWASRSAGPAAPPRGAPAARRWRGRDAVAPGVGRSCGSNMRRARGPRRGRRGVETRRFSGPPRLASLRGLLRGRTRPPSAWAELPERPRGARGGRARRRAKTRRRRRGAMRGGSTRCTAPYLNIYPYSARTGRPVGQQAVAERCRWRCAGGCAYRTTRCSSFPSISNIPYNPGTQKTGPNQIGGRTLPRPRKPHGREPPHAPPPSTPAYDPPPAETATTCTTGAGSPQRRESQRCAHARGDRGRGRETAEKSPRRTPLTGSKQVGGVASEEA